MKSWDATSDDDHDLTTGYFTLFTTGEYTGVPQAQAIMAQANEYLGLLFVGSGYNSSTATWLDATTDAGGGQDQIATPEPSSLMLLGVAGIFVRRRAKKVA